MAEAEQHQMELEATYPSGAEEWFCPTCGRRFLMQWTPTYNMIVIEAGDEHAAHSGFTGGLQTAAAQVGRAEDIVVDERKLSAWIEWLDTVDFDAWWERDVS